LSELINNLDISIRLALLVEVATEPELKVFKDALDEIEQLRAEVKKLKYLATL